MSRRGPVVVEGHEFTGWESAQALSDEAQEKVERIEAGYKILSDPRQRQILDDELRKVEGDLVPTCECGWKGLPDDWAPPGSRSRRGGQQHISHKHTEEMKRHQGKLGAQIAAAALDHAADAWTGDAKVEQWLHARADHVLEVGYYDGEKWPSEPTVKDA